MARSRRLVSLGFVAGRTRHLQLGVSALIVPQRNPFVMLKQLSSVDFLSDGRIVLAVAAGWLEEEFEVLGARRGDGLAPERGVMFLDRLYVRR
jgi:alkanesulfonate monooxygenase SsuD/methylene tetrahydromethanopterin reductase-like flavin-dependent oxidoreductase (luciferase family)